MDSKCVKVANNGHRVVDSKRKHPARYVENISDVSQKTFLLRSKNGSLLKKRKRPDGLESKCGVHLRKSLLKNYSNFMKSGLPERVLFYQNGVWNDFPKDIVELVRKEFNLKKAAIEVKSNGCHFMLDILYMIQVDFKTASQKPIAWIDEAGGCFFPEIHEHHGSELENDEDFIGVEENGTQQIKLHLQIDLNGVNSCSLEECVEESDTNNKRIKIKPKSGGNYLELANNDYNDKLIANEEEEVDMVQKVVAIPPLQIEYNFKTVELESVRKIFFEGMNSSVAVNILDINKCSSDMMQTRWEMFQKQAEITQKYRGDPNIHFAWFAATKDVLSSTMTYGFANCVSKNNATYGLGIHLTSVKCAATSANYCDVDENGVRHMVFCRVILGNVELVTPGSSQFHPSSETFDNGVDDLENPSHYIVWNMNMNTHIYPEYVVSFKMPPFEKVTSLIGKEHCAVLEATQCMNHQEKGQIGSSAVESGNAPSSGSSTAKTPKSPWMPFTMLFDAISPKVSQDEMNNLYAHYEEMKSKKLTRQEFISKLRSIVGDELLKGLILGLQSKFPVKAKCVPNPLIGKR